MRVALISDLHGNMVALRAVLQHIERFPVERIVCLGNDSIDVFRAMLRLKCVWSGIAVLGLTLSIVQGAPTVTWAFLAIFLAFGDLWNYYRIRLRP